MKQTTALLTAKGGNILFPKEYNDLIKIWKSHELEPLAVDYGKYLQENNVLATFFEHSPCVTRILDLRSQQYDFVSSNIKEIMGFDSSLFYEKGLSFNMQLLLSEDLAKTWKLIRCIWNFIMEVPPPQRACYKFSYDYRIRKSNGKQIWVLEQNSVLQQDSKGNITHVLSICTDITSWKKSGSQLASVFSTVDDACHLFTTEESSSDHRPSFLSKRELEIVKLMSEGFSSKNIAEKLFISFHTVNTHRQKIIEKTHTKNTGGLVQFAICNGLI